MQTKIQGMKSLVSCAGLDRITIKGSKGGSPSPLLQTEWINVSPCALLSEFLSRQQSGSVPALKIPSPAFTLWMSGLMKREHENYGKDECKKKKEREMKREWEMCVMLLSLFNQSSMFSTTGQAVEMLWLIITPLCSSEDTQRERERESTTESRLVHPSSATASGCMVICNCRPDKSHRGLSADVTGRNRCLIYCHICWAEWRHWSRRLSRGLQSPCEAFAVHPIAHPQNKILIRK